MRDVNVRIGTRAEILADLNASGADRFGQHKAERAQLYATAINTVEEGVDVVRVGSTVYLVADDGTSPTDWEIAAAARHGLDVTAG